MRLLQFLAAFLCTVPCLAQPPVTYRVGVPEAQHHRLEVEATFEEVPDGPLAIVMSRTSPGRYALHEFGKNVYDVRISDGRGVVLPHEQANPSEWTVTSHKGVVHVRYKVFGDRLDGTHLAVDERHAHLNIPAAFIWARGLESRPVRVTFDGPSDWRVATQLLPTADPRTFTAPNLAYFIDSPTELSRFALHTFTVDREFRLALHHEGSDTDARRFTAGLERIVREQRAIFGELPSFETPYTFIADYLPWATFDGMEHRNSTILTGPARLGVEDELVEMLSIAAHEFFHVWNVERIRPRSLEPFRLDAPNPSGELWFAEGFTSYYEPLTLQRSGLWSIDQFAGRLGRMLDTVVRSPARKYRSAVEVSLHAQYVDRSVWADRTNFENTHLSYYTWGAAIALGLDLMLRTRTDHTVTLDDYMRWLWREFGRPPARDAGTVARPFTMTDLQTALAAVSGDPVFAQEFFDRYIRGRDVVGFEALLAHAGLYLGERAPGRPWIGHLALEFTNGSARIASPTIEDTPAYRAGLDTDDELLAVAGVAISKPEDLERALARHRPGDVLRVSIRRRGVARDLPVTVGRDPTLHLVPAERAGGLSAAQRAFRTAWLGTKQ